MKDIKNLSQKGLGLLRKAARYRMLLFCLLLAIVYGVLLYRINVLSGAEPDPTDVQLQSKTAQVPHIDPSLISQLQSLQDNSVNVKALFDQARSNPFRE